MSSCHVWPSESRRPFISEQLPFNSEGSRGLGYLSTVLLQGDKEWYRALGRTKHQQAATTKVGGPASGPARPEQASVWADSISAWHRAGRRAPAVPGKGVMSGWQSFLYLAKLRLAKSTSHFSCFWEAEKATHPSHLTSQQVYLVLVHIFSWDINFLFILQPPPYQLLGCCYVAEYVPLIDKREEET